MKEPSAELLMHIKNVAEFVLRVYGQLPPDSINENATRKGGCITVMEFDLTDPRKHQLTIVTSIGRPAEENAFKYHELSQEKAKRLLGHLSQGHVTSRESADSKAQKYPGAIAAGNFIVSFSGLPANFDEALCVVVAAKMGWLSRSRLQEILEKAANPCIPEFGVLFQEFIDLTIG